MSDLTEYLSAGDGVIDIGANRGTYARRFAEKVGKAGYVLAVEPDPIVAEHARGECGSYPQIHIRQAAVSDSPKTLTLYRDSDTRRSSLWAENRVDPIGEMVQVTAVTLDSLANEVPRLRGIKIDAQGAESSILDGATQTLQRTNLAWYIELWPTGLKNAGSSVRNIAAVFAAAGYHPVEKTWAQVFVEADHEVNPHSSNDELVVWKC